MYTVIVGMISKTKPIGASLFIMIFNQHSDYGMNM